MTEWRVKARQSRESLGLLLMTDSEGAEGVRKLRDQASCLGIQYTYGQSLQEMRPGAWS